MLRLLFVLLLAGCAQPPNLDLAPQVAFDPPQLDATYALGQTGALARLRLLNLGEEPVRVESTSFADERLEAVLLGAGADLVPAGGFLVIEVAATTGLPLTGLQDVLHLEISPVGAWSREVPWPHDVPVTLTLSCDADGDGALAMACGGADCDDDDPDRRPGVVDLCDGVDQDCQGLEDEADVDGDGWLPCNGDCDDLLGAVHPGAEEQCDGVDTDCVGGPGPDEVDEDWDGVRACGPDCDDTDPDVGAPTAEVCNGRDDDCDGSVDEGLVRVPEDFATVGAALDAAGPVAELCLAPGEYLPTDAWSHDVAHLTLRGRGPEETTLDLRLSPADTPLLSMVDGHVGLHDLSVVGHRPMLRSEGGRLELRDVTVVLTPMTGEAGIDPILHAVDGSVDALGLTIRGSGLGWSLAPALRLDGGALAADDVLIEDFFGIQSVLSLDDVSRGLLSNVVSRRNRMVESGFSSIIRLVGDHVGIAGFHATDNVGTDVSMANQGGWSDPRGYVTDAFRRRCEGAMVHWFGGRGHLTRFDVRSFAGRLAPLLTFASSGWVDVRSGIVAGGFGVAVGFSPTGPATAVLENVTVVGTPGGDDVLAGNLAGTSELELVGSTVSLSGPLSRWVTSYPQEADPSVFAEGSNLQLGEAIDLEPGSADNLSADPAFIDVNSSNPDHWDLHLQLGSPLLFHPGTGLANPDGTDAHIGAYGGWFAGSYDFDGDGAAQHWHAGAFQLDDALDGLDCDDADPTVFGTQGCD